jgi:hypothetical protein
MEPRSDPPASGHRVDLIGNLPDPALAGTLEQILGTLPGVRSASLLRISGMQAEYRVVAAADAQRSLDPLKSALERVAFHGMGLVVEGSSTAAGNPVIVFSALPLREARRRQAHRRQGARGTTTSATDPRTRGSPHPAPGLPGEQQSPQRSPSRLPATPAGAGATAPATIVSAAGRGDVVGIPLPLGPQGPGMRAAARRLISATVRVVARRLMGWAAIPPVIVRLQRGYREQLTRPYSTSERRIAAVLAVFAPVAERERTPAVARPAWTRADRWTLRSRVRRVNAISLRADPFAERLLKAIAPADEGRAAPVQRHALPHSRELANVLQRGLSSLRDARRGVDVTLRAANVILGRVLGSVFGDVPRPRRPTGGAGGGSTHPSADVPS